MNHHLLASSHVLAQQWSAGTHLSALGFFWLGFVNVAMLVALLGAALRRPCSVPTRCNLRRQRPDARVDAVDEADTGAALLTDTERDAAVETVSQGIAEGRLPIDEGIERIDAALAARRQRDLSPVLDGLEPLAVPAPVHRRRSDAREAAGQGVAALVVAAAIVVQALVGMWMLWPVAVAVLLPLALARRQRNGRCARSCDTPVRR